jgi:hypothetical protein
MRNEDERLWKKQTTTVAEIAAHLSRQQRIKLFKLIPHE